MSRNSQINVSFPWLLEGKAHSVSKANKEAMQDLAGSALQ